ncbi:hypothetical protein C1645_840349 [Glomus cerebriforme]|uniref:CCHC-type domain-containing protein n=1 Tax=Glomus cerebriforme TaxID=658196 RepID=A0A397S4D5_9GLOM|nr:hypothetical protein C1645_840349 [Glomus cerebriforme]
MSLNEDQFKNLMAQMTRSFEQSTKSILNTFKNTGEDEEFSSSSFAPKKKNTPIAKEYNFVKYMENEDSFEDWRNYDNIDKSFQKSREKVNSYTHHFRNLLIKFDPDVKLPEEYQIHIYINGLHKGLAKAVAMEGPDSMKDIIDTARRAETVDLNNKQTSTPIIQSQRTTSYRPSYLQKKKGMCYRCGEKGHFAKECLAETPLRVFQNTNQNINYIHVKDLEQPVEQEAYIVGTRSRLKTSTTLSERTQTAQSKSQKERFLKQNANRNMDVSMKNVTPPKPKTKRGPSVVEQLPPYNITNDILTQKANKLLDKLGLKVQAPSQAMVVTANGQRSRAIGKVTDLGIAISSMLIPTTVQIIDSTDETLFLGMDWFERSQATLNFA